MKSEHFFYDMWFRVLGKWFNVWANNGIDKGFDNCAFCKEFCKKFGGKDACKLCPIFKHTGQKFCDGTPYVKWKNHKLKSVVESANLCNCEYDLSTNTVLYCAEASHLSWNMLLFLLELCPFKELVFNFQRKISKVELQRGYPLKGNQRMVKDTIEPPAPVIKTEKEKEAQAIFEFMQSNNPFAITITNMVSIFLKKRHDYSGSKAEDGGDDYKNFRAAENMNIKPWIAVMVRITEKVGRLQNFIKQGVLKVKDEDVKETFIDLANLAIISLVLYEETLKDQALREDYIAKSFGCEVKPVFKSFTKMMDTETAPLTSPEDIHIKRKPVYCHHCGNEFASSNKGEPKKYLCDVCRKTKQVVCHYCGKTFAKTIGKLESKLTICEACRTESSSETIG